MLCWSQYLSLKNSSISCQRWPLWCLTDKHIKWAQSFNHVILFLCNILHNSVIPFGFYVWPIPYVMGTWTITSMTENWTSKVRLSWFIQIVWCSVSHYKGFVNSCGLLCIWLSSSSSSVSVYLALVGVIEISSKNRSNQSGWSLDRQLGISIGRIASYLKICDEHCLKVSLYISIFHSFDDSIYFCWSHIG